MNQIIELSERANGSVRKRGRDAQRSLTWATMQGCSQDNFNCFYCTVLYAQILLAGNGRDMHLLVTMTYNLRDVYASDWSAGRYDLAGDCDSPDTLSRTDTDCTGIDYTLDQVNIPTVEGFLFNVSALTPTATGLLRTKYFPPQE